MKSPATPSLDFRNVNSLWGSVLVETLHRLGLRQAVISPGSRSTPLTIALARHAGIESIPVLDERSAAFFALGLAKRGQRPVLLLCTSGTAGANYFPAVIEAQESGVPLLVITADRPPEMRECSSGQTIDQQKIFGGHVNFYHELAVPEASMARLAYLRQTICQAWERALWPEAGPVHLNAPFRDPLPPLDDGRTRTLKRVLLTSDFFGHVRPLIAPAWSVESLTFERNRRGIVVLGPAEKKRTPAEIDALAELVHRLGWPVLVDSLSGGRGQAAALPGMITRYDAILRGTRAARRLRPEQVLCIGGWPISKPLRGWLESHSPEIVMVSPSARNLDALHGRTRHVRGSVGALAKACAFKGKPDAGYMLAWRRAERAAEASLTQSLGKAPGVECQVAPLLARVLPVNSAVVVANSMPVRDVEYFWPGNNREQVWYFNRGANGIDGTLSTALGVAHGQTPTVLLTGDLALLHDTNGLLLRPKFRGSLTVVLSNNNGGGIFEHLPVAQFEPPFEEFFATPQSVDFKALCAAHRVNYGRIDTLAQLEAELKESPAPGIRVLELRTDRKRDAAFRKAAFAAAARAADRAVG